MGYSVRQGLERYRRLVRAHRPSIVVAAFGAVNDHFPAQGLTDNAKIARNVERNTPIRKGWRVLQRDLRILNLTTYIADTLRGGERASLEDMMRDRRAHAERIRRDRKIAGRIDFAGPRRVSLLEFEESLRTLEHEVARDGARLILVSMPRSEDLARSRPVLELYSETIVRVSRDEGLDWVDMRGAFRRLVESGEAAEDDLLQDRIHPTPRGHQVIADELTRLILR
jgi:lysophospholipase L1-like esterase